MISVRLVQDFDKRVFQAEFSATIAQRSSLLQRAAQGAKGSGIPALVLPFGVEFVLAWVDHVPDARRRNYISTETALRGLLVCSIPALVRSYGRFVQGIKP
jgi:hypothetical protein